MREDNEGHHFIGTEEIRKYPAQLLSTAPELYEALKGLVAAKESVTMGLEKELFAKWLPVAKKALSKAEGRDEA